MPGLDPFTCLFFWGYASYFCAARAFVQAPADGDYKLFTAGGQLFGPYGRVQVF